MDNEIRNIPAAADTAKIAAPTYSNSTEMTYSAEEIASLEPTIDEKRIELRQRVDRLLVTLAVFCSAFVLFSVVFAIISVNSSLSDALNGHSLSAFDIFSGLSHGVMYGIVISGVLNSIFFGTRFFSGRSRNFKLLAAVLFPVTAICFELAGICGYFPYHIYNIIKIISLKKSIKAAE